MKYKCIINDTAIDEEGNIIEDESDIQELVATEQQAQNYARYNPRLKRSMTTIVYTRNEIQANPVIREIHGSYISKHGKIEVLHKRDYTLLDDEND